MFGRVSFVFLLLVLLCDVASVAKVSKKSTRSRQCLDLPEEILEQMFGRLSVGVLNAFHHALQLAPVFPCWRRIGMRRAATRAWRENRQKLTSSAPTTRTYKTSMESKAIE
uniref:Interleukin-17D n=1 Tax=Salmo salar TaxID=8030 RepID=B9EP19_SALSA|nr:Interleukin-17D precursor [Salmo salar]